MYRSSYYNSNLLNSKASHCIQQSEYIIEQIYQQPSSNKQNYSSLLNKSRQSQQNQLNRSNNSRISIAKDKEKSHMIVSRSQSIFLGDSKASKAKNFIDMNQRSKMSNNNRSMLKSCNNVSRMGPALKVLTESDLTENDEAEDHMFSDSESEYHEVHQGKTNHGNSRSIQSQKMVKSQSHTILRNTNSKPYHEKAYYKQNQIPQASNYPTRRQSAQYQPSQSYHSQQEQQNSSIQVPDFTFIPNLKLQIRHYSPNHNKKLSFSQLIAILPHPINSLRKVKKLSVINCCLHTLEGIEQFQCLEQVNFRKNQLREVEELYRIGNKQNIFLINVQQNDIEHYHLGRYWSLSQIFPKLQELNDKNYTMLKRKQRGDMRKLIQMSSKLEHQLRKTLKKQIRLTDKAILRMNPHLMSSHDQQTQRTNHSHQKYSHNNLYHEVSDNKVTEKDEYSYENYNNSLSKRSEVKSPTYGRRKEKDEENEIYEVQHGSLNPNSYSLGESSKEKSFIKTCNNQRNQLKQVSLGNLDNVPITKSVKCPNQKSPSKYSNKPQSHNKQSINLNQIPLQTTVPIKNLLEIRTQDLENESDLAGHLHQPTATFAMQKEREQQCSLENRQFMFRNNRGKQGASNQKRVKGKKEVRNDEEEIFEEFENDQDDNNQMGLSRISRISQIPTKRLSNNRRSMTQNNLRNFQQKSRLLQPYQNTSQQSFITSNQLYPVYQNTSYMGFSQLSQWRPNQSMDEDCLLKEKKDYLEEEKMVIATAMYMQGLLSKAMRALVGEGTRRKNMPRKRVFF